MNKVILIGNLTKDHELSQTNSGKVFTRFTLAVQRKYSNAEGERETDFLNIVVWGAAAENAAKYLSKGSKAGIVGEIQTRNYEAQDGTRRYVTDIVASEVEFLSTKQKEKSDVTEINEDESLPF